MVIHISNLIIDLDLREKETEKYFYRFSGLSVGNHKPQVQLKISEKELMEYQQLFLERTGGGKENSSLSFIEYNYVMLKMGNLLLDKKRCLFHGVSFQLGENAYIITGPSGVGKTTLFQHLEKEFSQKVFIMNGDKPILSFGEHGIIVHPSPWMGKENRGSKRVAPLAGIIYLKQAETIMVESLVPEESVLLVLSQFLYNGRKAEDIIHICEMADQLLRQVPVWCFKNDGTEQASQYLMETVLEEL